MKTKCSFKRPVCGFRKTESKDWIKEEKGHWKPFGQYEVQRRSVAGIPLLVIDKVLSSS